MCPFEYTNPTPMEHQEGGVGLTKSAAVAACTTMAVFYVAILYSPTLILRLPPPNSFKSFMIRRFVCAAVSSMVSLIVCFLILPIRGWDASNLLGAYGIRLDHIWQAFVYPLSLTSFMYAGSFALKLLSMLQASSEHFNGGGYLSIACFKSIFMKVIDWAVSMTSSVSSWRNYVVGELQGISTIYHAKFLVEISGCLWPYVDMMLRGIKGMSSQAPLTEELVFRACMIPLLLCGGFGTSAVIFLCPIFFSLAHLNHLLEFYLQQQCSLTKACQVVGFQLGYTVIFGAYASFLLVRTGHLTAPLVAHIFCNFMGLPVIFSRRSGIVTLAFVIGMLGFYWMLFPFTSPHLYNYTTDDCPCWHRYCNWSYHNFS